MHPRIFLAILLFLLGSSMIKSQVSDWQWAVGSDGTWSGVNEGKKIKTGKTGNVYVLGSFEDDSLTIGSFTIYHQSFNNWGENFFIVKYDSSGNVLLAKNLGKGYMEGYGFDLDNSDNFYISGNFYQDSAIIGGVKVYNNYWHDSYGPQIFLAKFDSNGNLIWVENNAINDGYYTSRNVHIDLSGNVYLFGYCLTDSLRFGSKAINLNDSISYLFIAKFTPLGLPIWIKVFGANPQGNIITGGGLYEGDITTDSYSNIILTGAFGSPYLNFDTITIYNEHPPGWWTDIFVAKCDSSGNVLWAKSQGGYNQNGDFPRSINSDNDGRIYLTGYFSPNSTFDSVTLDGYGAFLARYNPAGKLDWINAIYGSNGCDFNDVNLDRFGNEIVGGDFTGDSIWIDTLVVYNDPLNTYHFCLVLAQFDSSGNFKWITKGGGEGGIGAMCMSESGSLYVTGFTRDSLILSSNILTLQNSAYATFTAKWSPFATGVEEIIENEIEVLIFPNPATFSIQLRFPSNHLITISIFNLIGEKIKEEKVSGGEVVIDVNDLPSGLYIVRTSEGVMGKFVKK